jgi:hypothetical protein
VTTIEIYPNDNLHDRLADELQPLVDGLNEAGFEAFLSDTRVRGYGVT